MAELLILVVVAGVVLLYAVDRIRKLRVRARQMSAMNERLDVAAAKVDEQQERKQARVRASAELTSVLPAIKRPPLTLPGVPGSADEPGDEPAAAEPQAEVPSAPAGDGRARTTDTPASADDTPASADDTLAAAYDRPAAADAGNTADGAGAGENPAAQAADSPVTGGTSTVADTPETADEAAPEPVRRPEGTLTMGRIIPDTMPAPKPQMTSDDTMIMPSVPAQGPAPAGEAAPPPTPPRTRPRASQPPAGQPRAGQPRASQPRTSQPRTSQQSTSPEQANRD